MKLAIIADDLTGALDSAGPFAARGMSTLALTHWRHLERGLALDPDILSVNMASREIAPSQARAQMREVLAALPADTRLFKKVDSRLKGPIAEELSAFEAQKFLVVPAIPEFGRLVEGGRVTGFGVDTPIAVGARLGAAADRSAIPDIATVDDMDGVVRAAGADTVIVGARGAASALAKVLTPAPARALSGCGRNLVLAIGSRDPITRAQIARFKAVFPDALHDEAPLGQSSRASDSPRADGPVLLQAVEGDGPADPHDVAHALARSLSRLYLAQCDGLLISGGATAETVLDDMGIGVLEVLGEIVEGLPVSMAGALKIISKSGGFGEAGTLVEVVRRFGGSG